MVCVVLEQVLRRRKPKRVSDFKRQLHCKKNNDINSFLFLSLSIPKSYLQQEHRPPRPAVDAVHLNEMNLTY